MKILFVCTANVCRSALAEVVLRKKLLERGLDSVEVMSAGARNYEGLPREETMVALARKAGYQMGGYARHINDNMLDADFIICMEHFHVVEMQKRFPMPVGTVFTDLTRFALVKRQTCLTHQVIQAICIHTFWSLS